MENINILLVDNRKYFELLCIAKEPQPAVDVLELITEHLFKTYKKKIPYQTPSEQL